ncbi:Spy0128 family protein [Bifidobacterium phasiani]|uniref:VWA domain-containing protein n=1 Tax=Bifidobacterium phasiani TaxID=2834431 RepID=A0ABS6W6Z7_9BIFI|nr:FctA domain-containing protein [Bifidobacterium phasiani]MBW3082132.1 VWA domain-containing protein [Bifidobacterium phasiani]
MRNRKFKNMLGGGVSPFGSSDGRDRKRTGINRLLTAIVALVATVALAVPTAYAVTGDTVVAGDAAQQDAADGTQGDAESDAASVADVVEPSSDDDVRSADPVAQDDGSALYVVDVPVGQGDAAGSLGVEVTVPAGALPEGVALVAGAVEDADAVSSALTGAGVEYDGLLAVDVRFEDAEGNEVEPSQPVSVRFDTTQSVLGGDVDASTLAVRHLAEDADGAVESVDMVADAGDQSDGTVSVDGVAVLSADETADAGADAAVSAEFQVDSFSSFTITWVKNNYIGKDYTRDVEVSCVDADTKQSLPGGACVSIPDSDDNKLEVNNGQTILFSKDSDYAKRYFQISGYTYESAEYRYQFNNSNWTNWSGLTSLQNTKNSYSSGWTTKVNDNELSGSHVTVQVRLCYTEKENPDGGSGDEGETGDKDVTVTTGKTAVLNDDGNYDLTLSVTGDRGSSSQKQKVDVLFILDKSGSMAFTLDKEDEYPGKYEDSRMDLLQSSVKSLVDTVEANDGIDARYAAVAFAGDGGGNHGSTYTTTRNNGAAWRDSNGITSFVDDIDADGGTNYQRGIHEGIGLLKSARDDALTFVVFVSDGIPTYRGNYDDSGNGSSDPSNENINAAVNEIRGLSCDYFYALGMGPEFGQQGGRPGRPEQTVDKEGTANLKALANAVNATSKGDNNVFNASDTTALQNAFNQIASSITFFAANNVAMIDPLSKYVDLVAVAGSSGSSPAYQFTVKLEHRDSDGNYTVVDTEPIEVSPGEVGTSVTLSHQNGETTENVPMTVYVEMVGGQETIRVVFDSSYQLAQNYRYTVSTTITPSNDAKQYVGSDTNEDDQQTPDPGTGTHADENETGFWSNDNANAKVTYDAIVTDENGNVTSSTPGEQSFPKPVIQVTVKDVILDGSDFVTVKKVLAGRDWLENEYFDFKLEALNPENAPMPIKDGSQQDTLRIERPTTGSQKTTNTGSFGDITFTEPGTYTYTLQEVRPDDIADRYGLEYSTDKYLITVIVPEPMAAPTVTVQLVNDNNEAINQQPEDVGERIATFMNSITVAEQPVQKDLVGRKWGKDDEFTFRVQAVNDSLRPLPDSAEVPFQPMNATPVTDKSNTWEFTVSKSDTSCSPIEEGSDWTTCRAGLLFGAVNGYSAKSVKYLVYEIDDGEPGMTYSQARYTFDVGIDDSTGYLSINNVEPVKQDDGDGSDGSGPSTYEALPSLMFTNRYTEPVSALPLTGGDTTARSIMLAGGGVLLLAGAAWLLARRRRV